MADPINTTDGRQLGGGPGPSDSSAPGGSSGTGGYGNIQDRKQGRDEQGIRSKPDPQQGRGAAFDEAQGGGRDDQSLSREGWNNPQGEGGGLKSQMFQHERGGTAGEDAERDDES